MSYAIRMNIRYPDYTKVLYLSKGIFTDPINWEWGECLYRAKRWKTIGGACKWFELIQFRDGLVTTNFELVEVLHDSFGRPYARHI